MKDDVELKWSELKTSYNPSDFSFECIGELLPEEGLIGQESGIEALELGLNLSATGYNIYVSTQDVEEVKDYILNTLKTKPNEKNDLQDIAYVYGFTKPQNPTALLFHKGDGRRFKEDMEEFRTFLEQDLQEALNQEEREEEKAGLAKEQKEKREAEVKRLEEEAKNLDFLIQLTQEGVGFIPLNGKKEPISEEEYAFLTEEKRSEMKQKLEYLYEISEEGLKTIKQTEKRYKQYIEDLDRKFLMQQVGTMIKYLKEKYSQYDQVRRYLEQVLEDFLKNMDVFLSKEDQGSKGVSEIFPWIGTKAAEDVIKHFNVNLIVDHSDSNHTPIVSERMIGYGDLVGKIELDSEAGLSKVDFMQLRPGLLHKANGGYLILEAKELFESPGVWEGLKYMLKKQEIKIAPIANVGITQTTMIYPQPIKAQIKVILIGQEKFHQLLLEQDEDFKKLFKVAADFEPMIESNGVSIEKIARKVKLYCQKENLPDISKKALLKLVAYSNRLAARQDKMLCSIEPMMDLIREATLFEKKCIKEEDIQKVISIRKNFKKNIEKGLNEQYKQEFLMIDTRGRRIGQANGLATYSIGRQSFGRPIRITATTYKGRDGVVNIEQQAGLSGNSHTKGIQILTGFLGNKFAQEMPLSLCCNICFEQSYGPVDGDSASSAQLYAVLSSLSGVPLRQSIAITGSINQYGGIQPVGGVNEKIEGFYAVCKEKGLTGRQGVIIPYQNKVELLLEEEVIDAVKQKKFHVYAVKDFKEGLEILTQVPYEKIEQRVMQKLMRFNDLEMIRKSKKRK